MDNLNSKMAKGAAWMVLFKLLERSIGLISTLVLARLLIPDDFGLIAMAMSIIAGLELLRAFNFDVVLIQKQTTERKYYDTAWTFNLSLGVTSAIILFFLAPAVALFYNEDRLIDIIYVFAFGSFITSFENVGIVDFRKNLQFNKDFTFLLSKKLAGFSVAMILAFTFENYWALVFGTFASKLTGVILSYKMHAYRPKISFAATKELFNFSSWLLINNVLFYIKLHAADFVIGRNIGGRDLGFFTIGYEISNLPTTELVAPINRAIFPGYSKMATMDGRLKQSFLDVISFVFFTTIPIGIGIVSVAPLLVPVLLGDKWLEIIPVIQILAVFGVITSMQTNVTSLFLALGKPKVLTALTALYIVLLIPVLIMQTLENGIIGAAWAYFGVSLIFLPIVYALVIKELNLKITELLNIFWRPFIGSLLMYLAVNFLVTYVSQYNSFTITLIGLIGSVILGMITYVATVLICWNLVKKPNSPEKIILSRIFSIYKNRSKR